MLHRIDCMTDAEVLAASSKIAADVDAAIKSAAAALAVVMGRAAAAVDAPTKRTKRKRGKRC